MLNCKQLYLDFLKSEKISKEDLPYSTFAEIIKMQNKEIMKQIIVHNKSFNMGFQLGSIMAIEVENIIKTSRNGKAYTSINWPESLERKEELIRKGEIPLEVYRDKNGLIIGDNGGKEWQIYNLSETKPVFYWNRYRLHKEEDEYYPLMFIRNYQIKFTPKNCKMLYSSMFNNGVRYDKINL